MFSLCSVAQTVTCIPQRCFRMFVYTMDIYCNNRAWYILVLVVVKISTQLQCYAPST
jgi:hypothetical protein